MINTASQSPLVAHVIHRLAIGGLENGLVNLINNFPFESYRHCIVCMDDFTEFRFRIQRQDVEVFALNKHDGHDFNAQYRLYRLFRKIKPTIVHGRNLSALDAVLPARLAGVPIIVHGEHGRDVVDLDGSNKKLQWLRRLHKPFINHYITVSKDLEDYLENKVLVNNKKITQIYNGVNLDKFFPLDNVVDETNSKTDPKDKIVLGTVGRLQTVKNQMLLVRAFNELRSILPGEFGRLHLRIVGDGPLKEKISCYVSENNLTNNVELVGASNQVSDELKGFDVFILPSLAEGISNTSLEAMATGLPIIATNVGGNIELVQEGENGMLVPNDSPEIMASAIAKYVDSPQLLKEHGKKSRQLAEEKYSLSVMVAQYAAVYDVQIASKSSRKDVYG